jgi:cytochrome c biogenesis protein CcmG, thiol:disulfide interchange protein DsbE
MPAGLREAIARAGRAAREHKVTTAVFAVSLAAILALGAAAATSGTATSGTGASGTATSPAPRASDRPAPAFTLPALGGSSGQVTLAGYAGRPVIINFFASWCMPCRQETPLLARYYRSAHGTVNMLGIDSNDSQAAAVTFTRKAGVSYPLAYDPVAKAAGAFGVAELPQTFFLNARHQIVDRVFGGVTAEDLAKGVALMGRPAAAASSP